jgi:hypothetical protein
LAASSRSIAGRAAALGVLAIALLVINVRARLADADLNALLKGWRGWDDLAVATGYAASGDFPVAPYRITNRFRRDTDDFFAFRDALQSAVQGHGIRPAQFWRTVPPPSVVSGELSIARRFDDAGRGRLLGLGFRLGGGVSPFLLTWLSVLAVIPLVAWTAYEFHATGQAVAGWLFLAAFACSGFVLDMLTLGYSASGFYVMSLMLIVPLAVYAIFGIPTVRGTLLRAALAGLIFAWCAASRSACLLALGGLVAAFFWAARRTPSSRRALLLAGSVAALLLPYALLQLEIGRLGAETVERRGLRRPPRQAHDIWITLWQGLGDFDRSKGHVYLDKAGEIAVLAAGGDQRLSERSERIMRGLVLGDIRRDPVWFAGILLQRLEATVTLRKLWPWAPRDGASFARATHPSQGVTDSYYEMTARADMFRVGGRVYEAPVLPLLVPSLLLGIGSLVGPARLRGQARLSLAALAFLALGALPTPVLITTASAFEAQCFVLVHLLGFAFCVSWLTLARGAR